MPILAFLFVLLVGGWIEGIVEHWRTVVTVLIYIVVGLLALLGLAAFISGVVKPVKADRAATARPECARCQARAREQIQRERVAHTTAKEQLQDAYDQATRDMDWLLGEWR